MKNALRSALAAATVAVCSTAISAADAAGSWVQLVPAGTFHGRDGRGPWHTEGPEHLQSIVDVTRQLAGSQDLVVDFDHQSIFSATPGVGGLAPAAGWVKELAVREDGIWGRVEWTEEAQSAIRAGKYRYISPVFYHSKQSGKVMAIRLAGLTNLPNLDLAEVAASSLIFPTEPQEDTMKKILAALGLAEGVGEDGVIAAINAMQTSSTAFAIAAGLTKDATSEQIVAAVNSMSADLKKVRAAAKLQEAASGDEIVTAINSQSTVVDPTKYVPIAMVTEMQGTLKTLQDKLATGEAETAVNSAIASGRLAPSLRDWAMELHSADKTKFDAFVDKAPVLTATQRTDPAHKPAEAALDDTDMAVMSQMGLQQEAFLNARKQETK